MITDSEKRSQRGGTMRHLRDLLIFFFPIVAMGQYTIPAATGAHAGAAPSKPVLRCGSLTYAVSGTVTVPLCSGTAAGDLAVLSVDHAYTLTPPDKWTVWDQQPGAYVNGYTYTKILSAADITAGSVSTTAASPYDYVAGLVVYQGNTNGVREVDSAVVHGSSFTPPVTTSSSVNVLNTDSASYFLSNRGASTDTASRGTSQGSSATGNMSGAQYTETLSSSGSYSYNGSYSFSTGGGVYQNLVDVMGVAPSYPVYLRTPGIQHGTTTFPSISFSSNRGGARIIVAVTSTESVAGTISVTDTVGNTYSAATTSIVQVVNGINRQTQFLCAASIAASSGTNTLTISQSGGTYTFTSAVAVETQGGTGSCTPDATTTYSSGNGTAMSTGSYTITANDFVMAFGSNSENTAPSATSGTGYQTHSLAPYTIEEDGIINSTTANPSATAGLSGYWYFVGTAFK